MITANRVFAPLKFMSQILPILALCTLAGCAGLGTSSPGGEDMNSASASVPGSKAQFSLTIGDRVYFEEDQSILSARAQAVLDGQARWLNQYPKYRKIMIEGHADERGTRLYNLGLGGRRANAVRDYLISKGVSSSRLSTLSFGKERPYAACNAESCWSQNRRAATRLDGKQN